MAETDLNIILQLVDKATDGIKKVSSNFEDFSRNLKLIGREVSQVGSTITMAGAAITGPFVLAIKNASKNVAEVNQAVMKLQNTVNLFQESIARSAVPVINQFGDILNNLFNMFNSLSPAMRDSVVRITLITGAIFTLGGAFIFVVGKITTLIANIGLLTARFATFVALNPVLMIILAAIVAIGIAMAKWKWIADTIISTLEVLFLTAKTSFLQIKIFFEGVLLGILDQFTNLLDLLAKIPGPTRGLFNNLAESAREASLVIAGSLNKDLEGVQENLGKIGDILTTGQGDWSAGFEKLRTNIDITWKKLTQGNTIVQTSAEVWKKNYEGMKTAVGSLQAALAGAAEMNRGLAVAAQIIAIGMATVNTAEGITRAFKDYPWPFSMIIAAIIGAAGAIQIAVIASQKFAAGTDSVPAYVSPGEMIIPTSFAAAIRAGNLSLSGRGADNRRGDYYININVDRPVVSNRYDIDTLVEEVSRRFALEIERLR